jgi:hypothetical protein
VSHSPPTQGPPHGCSTTTTIAIITTTTTSHLIITNSSNRIIIITDSSTTTKPFSATAPTAPPAPAVMVHLHGVRLYLKLCHQVPWTAACGN